MRETTLRFPDLMLLVGTRVALGVGIGLLASGRMHDRFRKGAGTALLVVGALTTLPILLNVRASARERWWAEGAAGARESTGHGKEGRAQEAR